MGNLKDHRGRPVDPLDQLIHALKVVNETLKTLDDDFRGDPNLPEYRDCLLRKQGQFRAEIRALLRRN
jgi:hypothetical protein